MKKYLLIIFLLLFLVVPLIQEETLAQGSEPELLEKQQYTRIISLYSAHTENLVSLGAEQQMIGISVSDTYPEQILGKPRYSFREDPERFIAARPDLILIRPMIERAYPQLLSKLREAGITVVSLQPNSVEEIYDYWRELGVLSGHGQRAEEMITAFKTGLETAGERVQQFSHEQRPRVYFESIHSKMKTFAQKSIAIFALEQAGGVNIASDAQQVRTTNIAAYSKERILAHAEEIDVYLAQQGRMNPVSKEMIMAEPAYQAIKAVRDGKVYLIDEELVSRPTLRILEGVQRLNRILYSDSVTAKSGEISHGKK